MIIPGSCIRCCGPSTKILKRWGQLIHMAAALAIIEGFRPPVEAKKPA
jgi:hypothetical protein